VIPRTYKKNNCSPSKEENNFNFQFQLTPDCIRKRVDLPVYRQRQVFLYLLLSILLTEASEKLDFETSEDPQS